MEKTRRKCERVVLFGCGGQTVQHQSPAGPGSPVGWGLCLAPAADWLRGDSSDPGEGGEPAGLPGEPGLLSSATLVVAVMGRWGVATGAACS